MLTLEQRLSEPTNALLTLITDDKEEDLNIHLTSDEIDLVANQNINHIPINVDTIIELIIEALETTMEQPIRSYEIMLAN